MLKKILIVNIIIFTLIMGFASSVMANDAILAPNGCEDAASSQLDAGTEIYYEPSTIIGSLTNGQMSEAEQEFAAQALFNGLEASFVLSAVYDGGNIVAQPASLIVGEQITCFEAGLGSTVMMRQILFPVDGWIIDNIRFESLMFTDDFLAALGFVEVELNEPLEMAPEPDGLQLDFVPQGENQLGYTPQAAPLVAGNDIAAMDTPMLSEIIFHFWKAVPNPSFDTPDSLLAPEMPPQQLCSEYTAPSYLSVGMQAEMDGYAYIRFPQSGDLNNDSNDNWLELGDPLWESDSAAAYFADLRATTALYSQAVDDGISPSIVASANTLFAPPVYGAPIVTILAGPYCSEQEIVDNHPCPDNGPCEYTEPVKDRYSIWWQIEVTVHNETYIGWYPENWTEYAWWLWELDGGFDKVTTVYLLTPVSMAMQTSADNCFPQQFVAGTEIQPSQGAMNLRRTPNGEIVGRLEANQTAVLSGLSECVEGYRWHQTNSGQWLAESDGTQYFLRLPDVPVPTEEVQPERPEDNNTGQSSDNGNNSTPRPTEEPRPTAPIRATQDPARG